MTDSELLRQFVEEQSEDAFAELVRRRVGLVYTAALRQMNGDAHRAEDITQEVFIDLARKARALSRHPALIGWLYTSTHFAAAKLIRGEQRRSRREEEAQAMSDVSAVTTAEPNWDQVRPVLDAAMHELSERDRQAVLLRFFDQQPFARIGEVLGMSENAAQKTAERALDKLQAALTRRGVKSTAAALGLALASQATGAVPGTLAASVTGAALTAAAAGGGAAAGVLAGLGIGKLVAIVSVSAAVFAGGTAVVEHRRARDAGNALVLAEQQQRTLAARLEELSTRTQQAETRAAEAERDNEALLKAVDAVKGQRAAAGAAPKAPKTWTTEDDEGALYQQAYQQALARRRAEEAKARARIDEDVSRIDDAAAYRRLINLARHLAAEASFQEAARNYNKAMLIKPASLEITPEIGQLRDQLQAQTAAVDVTLVSDMQTWVGITNVRAPAKFHTASVKLLPGNYEIVGRRRGYRDVVIKLEVRAGQAPGPESVICTVSTDGR